MLDTVVIAEGAPASSEEILSPAALVFLADLARTFRNRVDALRADDAEAKTTSTTTRAGGRGSWTCARPPAKLALPRVDLVGAADTASVTRALSSHASAFVADMDDAVLPCWRDLLGGQAMLRNLHRRARRSEHAAHAAMPPILFRPRSLASDEEHVFVDARAVPAGLADVGLYCFHNAALLNDRHEGPWLSLTKLRGRVDARLWSDIAAWIEERLAIRMGSLKFSIRVDSVTLLDDLEQVLWTLRARVLSVACGRHELLSDFITTSARSPSKAVTPARSFLTVDRPPLANAAARIVDVCRRRGAQTVGPVLSAVGASRSTFARVYATVMRQARMGFDGARVVDADLVPVARAALAASLRAGEGPNGTERPAPPPTENAVRENIEVALVHLRASFEGQPCVRLDSSLEDGASARAARAQLWEWQRARIALSPTEWLDRERFARLVREESARLSSPPQVRALLEHICLAENADVLVERETRLHRELTTK